MKNRETSLEQIFTDGERVLLTVLVQCPFEGESVSGRGMKRIKRYYERIFGAFCRYCRERLLKEARCAAQIPYTAALTYNITQTDGDILSLWYERKEQRGGEPLCVTRFSDTWRKSRGQLLELSELLGGMRKKRAAALTLEAAKAQTERGEDILYSDYRKLIPKLFSPRRFFVEDGKVKVYYEPCTIGPREEGTPVFTVASLEEGPLYSVVPTGEGR